MQATRHEMKAAEAAADNYRQQTPQLGAVDIYTCLSAPNPDPASLTLARQYLDSRLEEAEALQCDLPADIHALATWIEERGHQVGLAYEEYLAERKAGGPRRYFSGRAHALNFLTRVAPTKLVDGSWLYSTLHQWRDPLFRPLIITYLEELGDGDPAMNHVAMFRNLLLANGCEHTATLSDDHYVQGAIQLALAHHGDALQAEVFGFNLGYEQLPLHLLISAYELNELGIDPYYFTLHVTIDNAASGHARKAAQAVVDAASVAPDMDDFLRRMRRGYLLNELGASTVGVINSFNLEQELIRLLVDKARFGHMMHSDHCRIGGKTVNQWLGTPTTIPQFLAELEKGKWICRGVEADKSKFWRLIDATGGEMFGVFTGYEKQILKEWIENGEFTCRRTPTFRAASRMRRSATAAPALPISGKSTVEMDELIDEMSPGRHHLPAGLDATRVFSRAYRS